MSDNAARAALSRMHMREVAIAPQHANLIADLQLLSSIDPKVGQERFLAYRGELAAAYGAPMGSVQSKPFAFAQGLAIIPVHGSLINRFSGSYGSVTGYNFIRAQAQAAAADPEVQAIVFDLNSGGGEAAGCFELSAELANLEKPTLGIIDSNCYSACYAIGSALDRLVATPSGGAGSIGVVMMHVNMEKMLKDFGVEVSFIYSGEHKIDGNPFMSLPDPVRAELQAGADASRQRFAQLVATNRGMDVQAVLDTEARTYRAEAALAAGLIDAVATPTEAVSAFLSELSGSNVQPKRKDQQMSAENKPGSDEQAARAEARTAERARIHGIQSCEEAKGRESLANHLALNTEMSVADAKAILSAAPVQAAAQPAAATPAATDPLAAAMANSKQPNVGADAGAGAGGTEQSAAARILAAQSAATGVKHA